MTEQMTSLYSDEQMSEMFLKGGNNQFEIEEYESAIKAYTNSINKNQQNFTAYLYRGKTKSVLKDFKGAIEDYSKALEVNPELVNAYVERGFAKDDTSDSLGAIADLRKAVEIDPNHEQANLWLGVLMKNNEIDSSEFYLKKAANLGNEDAVKLLEQNEISAIDVIKTTYDFEVLKEIVDFGCNSGAAHKHVTTEDTVPFYDKFEDQIRAYISEELGEEHLEQLFDDDKDSYKHYATWCFIELIASKAMAEEEKLKAQEEEALHPPGEVKTSHMNKA